MIFIPSYHFTINSQICKLDCNTHCTVTIRNCSVSPWLGALDEGKEWPSAQVFKQYRACRWIILYNSNFNMQRFSMLVLKSSELHLIVCQGLFQQQKVFQLYHIMSPENSIWGLIWAFYWGKGSTDQRDVAVKSPRANYTYPCLHQVVPRHEAVRWKQQANLWEQFHCVPLSSPEREC